MVNQNLPLPVDLHDQATNGLLYFISDRLPVLINLLESVEGNLDISISLYNIQIILNVFKV